MHRAAICVGMLLSAGAAAEQMTIYNVATGDHFVELGQEGGAGDMIVWHSEVKDEQGEKLGSGAGSCIRVDAAGNYMCSMTIGHDGHGTINASGVQADEPAPSVLTILGGTGAYEGITGTVQIDAGRGRARFRYEVDYRLD